MGTVGAPIKKRQKNEDMGKRLWAFNVGDTVRDQFSDSFNFGTNQSNVLSIAR